jgi:hypothetical protein
VFGKLNCANGLWLIVAIVMMSVQHRTHAQPATAISDLKLTEFLGLDLRVSQLQGNPLTVTWTDVPIRDAAANIALVTQACIMVDRRVDSTQRVNVAATDTPLGEVLDSMAESLDLTAQPIGPVVYIGHESHAAQLSLALARSRIAAHEWRSAALRRRVKPNWDQLSTPRQVVARLASDVGIEVRHAERIPHDLLESTTWPPMSTADALTLILCGFDLTWAIDDDRSITIVPIGQNRVVDFRYAFTVRHRDSMLAAAKELGTGVARQHGNAVWVRGTMAQHLHFATFARLVDPALPTAQPAPTAPVDNRRFTLRVQQQPTSAVLGHLSKQLKVTVDANAMGGDLPNTQISFAVEQATVDELLATIAEQANIAIRREENRWIVSPR